LRLAIAQIRKQTMILQKIVDDNREELEARKSRLPLAELRSMAQEQSPPLDFASAICGEHIRLIAEMKKASPSRGVIRHGFDPVAIAQTYADNGAAAISVLTEKMHFQGSLDHLRDVRESLDNRIPLLRKDFIHDPYQIYESRAYGADSLLLIVAMLSSQQIEELLGLSHELGMSCLVEVHNEDELGIALQSGARIIGINNRDLNTFNVDISITERLRPLVLPDRIVVSESGIKDRSHIEKMSLLGVNAILVGESLMSTHNIAARMKELLS
jgi:indole-3-glycerol phosphate synthase